MKYNGNIEPQTLSITDTARALSIGKSSVYNLIRNGKLPVFKIGARSLIRREDIKTFLAGPPDAGAKKDHAA